MGELIAVVREDKNGKKTTRWVKPSASSSTPAKKIPGPAPIGNAGKTDTPLLNEALSRLPQSSLKKIDPRAQVLLEKALKATLAKNSRTILPDIISNMVRGSSYGGMTDLNNLAVFFDSMNDDDDYQPYIRGLSYVRGKWQGNEFSGITDFLTQTSPEKLAKAQAWMYAASHLGEEWVELLGGGDRRPTDPDYEYDEYGDLIEKEDDNYYDDDSDDYELEYRSIYNDDLTRLILDYPHKVEQIVDEATNYGIKDVGLIRERVLHPQQALREGVL